VNSAKHLIQLAMSALDSDCVVAITRDDRRVVCEPPHGVMGSTAVDYGPIVGVVCPPEAAAVAYPIDVAATSPGGRIALSIAMVVPRHGESMAVGSDRLELHPYDNPHTIIDLGWRSLAVATPPPEHSLIELLDRIWLDRVLRATLDADLGIPPTWRHLGPLHPALPSLAHPDRLGTVRESFTGTWESLRRQVALARIRWTGMVPSVAEWLDEGSFSRWCIADTPEIDVVLADLAELLDPPVFERVRRVFDPLEPVPAPDRSRQGGEL